MDEGQADLFLTYCTNAAAAPEVPRLQVVQLPPNLQVGAAYGWTVRANGLTLHGKDDNEHPISLIWLAGKLPLANTRNRCSRALQPKTPASSGERQLSSFGDSRMPKLDQRRQ